MEWLRTNLGLAFPFADGAAADVAELFADGWVASKTPGQLWLEIFNPLALTNAHVRVVDANGITVLETLTATATVLGDFTVLDGTDVARGSSYRFIVDSAAVALFPGLLTDVALAGEACVLLQDRVTTLNGLQGDVRVVFDQHVSSEPADGKLYLNAVAPIDRVDCSATDCAKLFQLGGQRPDQHGSAVIEPDGCYRLVPHPTLPNTLLLYNHCTPCLECADIDALDAALVTQAAYYHQLAAIHHDQHNRYQDVVAKANERVEAQEATGALILPCGTVDINGRAFGRPYFTQVALAIVNSSTYSLSLEVVGAVTPIDLATALEVVDGSAIVQRYGPAGASQTTHSGLPGTVTVLVGPGETVVVSAELHLVAATLIQAGTWTLTATATFLGGCATLPAPQTIVRALPFTIGAATPTVDP